jgi:hypothetical protein
MIKIRCFTGARMLRQEKQGWEVFAELASKEQDPGKLRVLIAGLNSALDEKYASGLRPAV